MDASVKNEFFKWIKSLDEATLSEHKMKLLNAFISNFDNILPLGTASGKRAHKISEIIQSQYLTLATELPEITIDSTSLKERITHISELEIGPFRGFASKEKISFDRKYIFLHGPNGSGKSSFCEGLEYALLGDIAEASAKRIELNEYIRNTVNNQSEIPVVYTGSNAKKQAVTANHSLYRFAFIEKNRIDGFARITAATPSEQKDRIATLFGLDAFSLFVDGFTDNFSTKLPLVAVNAQAFESARLINEENILRLAKIDEELTLNNDAFKDLIKKVAVPSVTTHEMLKLFLLGEDGISGKISQLQKNKAETIPDNIILDSFDQLPVKIDESLEIIKNLNNDIHQLMVNIAGVKYSDLYSALTNLEAVSRDVCPACKTPLSSVVVNPFENAKAELEKLKILTELQERISSSGRDLNSIVNEVLAMIEFINGNIEKLELVVEALPSVLTFEYTNIVTIQNSIIILQSEINSLTTKLDCLGSIRNKVETYNMQLEDKRKHQQVVDDEIKKYLEFENKRNELSAREKMLIEEKTNTGNTIDNFQKENAAKISKIETEKNKIEVFQKFALAYDAIIKDLKNYRNGLPSRVSEGLSEKAMEYYNTINSHDPHFEHLAFLSLPSSTGAKITLTFKESNQINDALHVLSDGHIKVLGLSILLAKIYNDGLGFVIFDDVVNAIDDDHRSGIADLLLSHPDFNDKQMIITCHGEQFINKLEHKLGASTSSTEVTRYRFYPADSIDTRGIKISIGDIKHYIVQAEEAFSRNELKNSAFKCRQAVESISDTLWKKLAKEKNVSLTVKIRAPGVQPDLSTVVDSLIKEVRTIDPISELYKSLSRLKEKYPWSLLNKGAHEQDEMPEFERLDISNLIELIKGIETQVIGIKFNTALLG